jgi:hypothetical protein
MLYTPYAHELWQAARKVRRRGNGIDPAFPTLPSVYGRARNQDILLQFAGRPLKAKNNPAAIEMLYGIDARREVL